MRNLRRDQRGTAVVEFAIVLPVLAVLLFGMLSYGQYFLLAHSAQQLANDAARATVAGMTPAERLTLAQASIARERSALPEAAAATITAAVEEAAERITVRVRIDASAMPLFRTAIVPLPDSTIERRAVVRPGGFV